MTIDTANPFPGPRPFRTDEAQFFFGRDHESRDVFSLVTAHREILIYAESGSGKTSLLNAGLAPLLEDNHFLRLPSVRMNVALPRGIEVQRIANIFAFKTAIQWCDTAPEAMLSVTLKQALERQARKPHGDRPRVAVFDQFEELFTIDVDRWPEREQFFEQLAAAMESDPLLRVIFVIREDYIAQLEPYSPLLPSHLRVRIRLERLGRDAAFDAIRCPLELTGRSFEDGVAEKLVEDLLKIRVETTSGEIAEIEGQYVEPVQLQVVCQALCRELAPAEAEIRREHLDKIGSIDRVLSRFYDDAVLAAAAAAGLEEEVVRVWCSEKLVTSVGTRGTVYRERKSTGGLPNAAVDVLAEKHLIRAERRAGVRWYELTHDRFIEPIRASNEEFLRRQTAVSTALYTAGSLWQRGRLAEALEQFEDALQHVRRTGNRYTEGRILHALGEIRFQMADIEGALHCLQSAVAIFHKTAAKDELAAALASLGHIYSERDEFEAAIAACTEAIAIAPNEVARYMERGSALWYAGRLGEAIDDFNVVLSKDPHDLDALSARGQVLAENGLFDRAVEDLTQAIRLAEKRAALLVLAYASNGRGLAYGGLRRFPKAMRDFDRSISLAPNNAWVYFNRAQVHLWRKKPKAAVADLRVALRMSNPPLNALKRERAKEQLREQRAT